MLDNLIMNIFDYIMEYLRNGKKEDSGGLLMYMRQRKLGKNF